MTLRARRHGLPARTRMIQMPASTGGLNRLDPVAALPPSDATLLVNLVAAEYGLRSRLGSHEWVTGMTGTADNTVRTIIPFDGAQAHTRDKLFATTDKGIWDVTASTQAPSPPAGTTAFGIVDGDSGRGSTLTVADSNGNHNLIYCDESNGYFVYADATATWTKVTQGAGATQIPAPADPTKFVHACLYASRIWFTEKNSTRAWYLGVFGGPAIYGTANYFDFGPYFRSGGYLVGLFNWTIDGGTGVTNRLVAISSSGDIVIFQGIDPSLAIQWSIVGIWSLGSVPAGRNVATTFGGDLLVLSTIGIIPLSRLVVGNPVVDRTQYATYKITNLFNALMYNSSGQLGWSIRLNPQDNTLMVNVPQAGQTATQLVMALTNRSWTQYMGLDIVSNEVFNGTMYFGTSDGRVLQHTDYIDGVLLSDPSAYTPISCQLLTAFQSLDIPVTKKIHLIRPRILAQGAKPTLAVQAFYDFNLSLPDPPAGPATTTGATWDVALWDTGVWQADYVESESVSGAQGMGVYAAVGISFQAIARTILVGFDLSIETGGFL